MIRSRVQSLKQYLDSRLAETDDTKTLTFGTLKEGTVTSLLCPNIAEIKSLILDETKENEGS